MKNVVKNEKKVFTKNEVKDIMKKNYNLSKIKVFLRKRGEKMKVEVLEKELNLKEIVNERITKNANLFSKEELSIIKNNSTLTEKIYILGILDNMDN